MRYKEIYMVLLVTVFLVLASGCYSLPQDETRWQRNVEYPALCDGVDHGLWRVSILSPGEECAEGDGWSTETACGRSIVVGDNEFLLAIGCESGFGYCVDMVDAVSVSMPSAGLSWLGLAEKEPGLWGMSLCIGNSIPDGSHRLFVLIEGEDLSQCMVNLNVVVGPVEPRVVENAWVLLAALLTMLCFIPAWWAIRFMFQWSVGRRRR